jgi:hypothetical protein
VIRKTIYGLKRRFGFPIDIYWEKIGEYNPETGEQPVEWTKYPIRRAVVFPGMVHRDIFYSITFLRANSNFAYGGDIQNDDRQVIIDGGDLPKGFKLTDQHYFVFNNERWDLQKIDVLEDGISYGIQMRRSRNTPTHQEHDLLLKDKLNLTESMEQDNDV